LQFWLILGSLTLSTIETEFTTVLTGLLALNKTLSNPYMRRDIGKVLTQNVPTFKIAQSADSALAVSGLQQQGYYKLSKMPPDFNAADVRARLDRCLLINAQALNYQHKLAERIEFLLKDKPADVFLASYKAEDVIRCTPLVKLACHSDIVAAIQAYLGCAPTISGFQIWHTFPGFIDVPAENFHRDRDCFRFVKLFVYLSDVDSGSGPHQFVKASHNPDALQGFFKSKGINVDLARLFEGNSRNLKLADIESMFGSNILTVAGPAGSAFLEDTYGLHRGTRPTSSARMIFSVTYTGLPLRYANENDRTYEMNSKFSFAEAGLNEPSELERYVFRFYLH
jgi:hypothetical protein